MRCVVCTLFEHHYHFGAAVLINSLAAAGFRGTVYAGFRGPLPPWAKAKAQAIGKGRWDLQVVSDLRVIFLELDTTAHLTNYKPNFLLEVERLARQESEAVIYLDPDIVICTDWLFLEEWASCGISLCEDVNSPLGRNHPRRVGWQRFFGPLGFQLHFQGPEYANGGYFGISWEHREFLLTWQRLIAHIAKAIGGMDVAGISGGKALAGRAGFANCLDKSDQDALNAALELHPEIPASFLPPATMGFQAGRPILPHALGSAKPWLRRYIREALGGRPPRAVDKAFWKNAEGPLKPYSSAEIARRRWQLALASGLGRLIRRT